MTGFTIRFLGNIKELKNDDLTMHVSIKIVSLFPLMLLLGLNYIAFLRPTNAHLSNSLIIVPEDYPTIQNAIDMATEEATILVKPGKYVECLRINKSLRLIGSGVNITVLENAGEGHTIEITKEANNVFLKGFTIQGLGQGRWSGIHVKGLNHSLEDNFVTGHFYGIQIYDSSNNVLRNNAMTNNTYNFGVWGLFLSHFFHDIDFSNSVEGKPILYWMNQQDKSVPYGVGYVALVNSSRITVKNLTISNNLSGVLLAYTNNSLIMNVTATKNERGLYMVSSYNNTIIRNNFSDNEWSGISAVSSSNNIFAGNNITQNKHNGIRLSHSSNLLHVFSENNVLIGNLLNSNGDGLYLEESNNNLVSGNTFIGNTRSGIVLDESHGNILQRNLIENNKYGVWTLKSKDLIYHNVFTNNSVQVHVYIHSPTLNAWDNDYPSGGNYWSDYTSMDEKSGPNQDEPESDGIGDNPYIIDINNQDRYPLLQPCVKNVPPNVDFRQNPVEARVGENILLNDESSDIDGQILLRIWKIDEEYYWMAKEISRQFEEEKTCTVTLIVFDDDGATNSTTKKVFIRRLFSTLTIFAPDHTSVGDTLEISAVLLDEDGNPITEATVHFYLIDNLSEQFIDSASTNSSGTATIFYKVKREGNFQIKSLFLGNQKYAGSSMSNNLVVKGGNHYMFWIFIWLLVIIVVFTSLKFKRRIKVLNESTQKR